MPNIREKSNTINYLRAIAIILVVVQHAMSYGAKLFETGVVYSYCISILDCIHVPLFFMISGYLCHKQNVITYYKKKFYQLLIPFFFFTSGKLVYNLFFDGFAHADSKLDEILKAFIFGEYYWFSYCLFVFCLLAPLLWCVKSKKGLGLFFLLFLALDILNGYVKVVTKGGPFQLGSVFVFGIWFVLGYIIKQFALDEAIKNRKLKKSVFAISAVILIIFMVLLANKAINAFLAKVLISVTASYVLYCLLDMITADIAILNHISRYSYQIFFLDSFVKVILFLIVSKFITLNFPVVLVLALVNIMISCLICTVAHKIKGVRFLFGLK